MKNGEREEGKRERKEGRKKRARERERNEGKRVERKGKERWEYAQKTRRRVNEIVNGKCNPTEPRANMQLFDVTLSVNK